MQRRPTVFHNTREHAGFIDNVSPQADKVRHREAEAAKATLEGGKHDWLHTSLPVYYNHLKSIVAYYLVDHNPLIAAYHLLDRNTASSHLKYFISNGHSSLKLGVTAGTGY